MRKTTASHTLFWALFCCTALLYFYNIGINDLWTENESFYGEAVREMTERGNFLDITYNYLPRFQKPPLTYWLMALSTHLFGMNELAMRLPIVLLGFGAALLTWSMAKQLYGPATALLSFAMEAVSFQVVAGKHYASPETPLLFFFTLTLWLFLKWDLTGKRRFMLATGLALGLTVLTKGYPYLILFTAIALWYLLPEKGFSPSAFFRRIWSSNLLTALVISGTIGILWYGLMYLRNGDAYLAMLNRETVYRALGQKSDGNFISGLLFYPGVTMWSFFPYSTLLLAAIPYYASKPEKWKEVRFAGIWVLTMLVMFTAAKGKIPTYFIQANPALALICSHFAMNWTPGKKAGEITRKMLVWLPAAAGVILSVVIIVRFGLPATWYLIPAGSLLLAVLPFLPAGLTKQLAPEELRAARFLPPFLCVMGAYFCVMAGLMPAIEQARPYDRITAAFERQPQIPHSLPLQLQDDEIKNLPFYARRHVVSKADPKLLFTGARPVLAMVRSADVPPELRDRVFWSGEIYRRRSSESRLMLFIESYLKQKQGNHEDFVPYSILYVDNTPHAPVQELR